MEQASSWQEVNIRKKKQRVRGSQEEDALKDAQDAEGRDIRFEVFLLLFETA